MLMGFMAFIINIPAPLGSVMGNLNHIMRIIMTLVVTENLDQFSETRNPSYPDMQLGDFGILEKMLVCIFQHHGELIWAITSC